MGLVLTAIKKAKASQVYFDANIFIYALEGISPFSEELRDVFKSVDNGQLTALTSELSLAECMVKPFMEKDSAKQATFEKTFTTSDTFEVIPVSRPILKEAALLRATYTALRLPDAIHLATALFRQCTIFLTNDSRMKSTPQIQLLLLKDYIHQ